MHVEKRCLAIEIPALLSTPITTTSYDNRAARRYNARMLFTLTDIAAQLPPERFNKGWQLFNAGIVTAPNIQRGGELITAVIPQYGGRPLRVYVRADNGKNEITINGECSCGTKHNCEHVAAVLLQALKDQQALPGVTDMDTALPIPGAEISAGTFGAQPAKPPGIRQALLYILHLDDAGLLVETQVARPLQHGGYSAGSSYDPGRAAGHTPARFLEPADLELISAINKLQREPDTNLPRLEGAQSAAMLETMLLTGRCFFEDIQWGTPLSLGPARRLEFEWQANDFGYQRPLWRIIPEADTLLSVSPTWYFDENEGECGPLSTKLESALIHEMATLALAAPQDTGKVYNQLRGRYPDSPIPPPRHFDVETAPRVKPVPCLRLTTIEEQMLEDWSDFQDMAVLTFDYGGVEIDRHNPPARIKDGRVICVQRDKKAETAALKQVRKLGFEADEYWRERTGADCFFPEPDFSGSDYMDNDAEAWLDLQTGGIPELRAQGWRIEYDNFRYRLCEAGNWVCDIARLEQQDWFSIGLDVEVEGERVGLLPILLEFLKQFPRGLPDRDTIATEHFIAPFVAKSGGDSGEERLLRLPAARVLPLLDILLEIYGTAAPATGQELRFSRVQLTRLTALDQPDGSPWLQLLADDDVQQLARRLRDLDGISEVTPPAGLEASLRPYQQQGLNWLQFLREYQLAGILADDMGLGKTVQALAHLLLEKEAGRAVRPSLVVAPTSLMFNWRHEAERFAPQLKVLILHGPQRQKHFAAIGQHDLIITTYPLLVRDKDTLLAHNYHLLILDEAQVIKNPKAHASRVVRGINAGHRLCLTGTPLENHLGELWALFDFLLPGLLGDSKQFRRFFRTPIEQYGNEATADLLSRRIRPFLLRRTKQQVAKELPPKTEIIQTVALAGKQRELYETVRLAMHRRVREEIRRQGLSRSHIVVLDALLKLRQVCCDPRLLKTDKAHDVYKNVNESAKLDMLLALLPEMIEEGRRILVFSQFTTMLGLIEDALNNAGIGYVKLTGQTRDRQAPVQRFQNGEAPLFLISLKAGGVGLNLTAADTVIHYDPWWNPAVERQATDRAHRIGQQQAVFAYKLICEGTLEEKILAMQQRKQTLADGLYQEGGGNEPLWTEQDLEALFSPLGDD